MTTIEYNGAEIESVQRYCQRRFIQFRCGGNGKFRILYDGATVCELESFSQVEDVLALSANRVIPSPKEIGFYFVRGMLTFCGFYLMEKWSERWG